MGIIDQQKIKLREKIKQISDGEKACCTNCMRKNCICQGEWICMDHVCEMYNGPYISSNKIIEDLKLQIAELQKELDYKKQNELEILEIIKTQESFESLYDKYSGTTKEEALGALEKCAEEADNIIKNLLFELHTVKESEKVEAYEADKMRIKNQELKLKIRNLQGKIRYLENMIRYNSRNNSDNKTQIKQK